MKALIQAITVMGAVAAPAVAQDSPQDVGGLLDAMTCREFVALEAQDQMNVMLAMRAHASGDPLPDGPLPIGLEAEIGGAEGLDGDSRDASAEGLETGTEGVEATGEAAETDGIEAAASEAATADTAAVAGEDAAGTEGTAEDSVAADQEVADSENESGKVDPDGNEASVTDEPGDPKLTAMRTSCEGGPDALASDAMRAAHADYE